ncbi:tetratricopeptide repeat protein [Thiosulfativibrio zosterae]|uniref:Co-chaperone YbbN n=1 Tax=Thiosulfativibrio zosterae TaxID=2675053 RepID=A0A6F8PNG4_9GAMM|nr:tetratricopeptide repeat protein [Thiosulfativibrio zosterae]BBP43626.1 co-chaperone YbbN [Thiosulfativibrio zosterae]
MSQTAFIFDINAQNFDDLVLKNSHKLPVILEFMAVYSGPCITLEQTLTAAAKDCAGQFVFAKVDIDEQPELAQQFDIQNVPTTFVMKNGDISEAVEGLIKPDEVAALLRSLGIFRVSDDLREQARTAYLSGQVGHAIQLLTQAAQQDPSNPRVAMDMVQIMIDLDQFEQAKTIFNQLPDSAKQSDMGRSLLGQLTFKDLAAKTLGKEKLIHQIAQNPQDGDALFDLAICLVAEHDYETALNHLFTLYQLDKDFKNGAAKEMIVSITNMLEANAPELCKKFRKRFANLNAA